MKTKSKWKTEIHPDRLTTREDGEAVAAVAAAKLKIANPKCTFAVTVGRSSDNIC